MAHSAQTRVGSPSGPLADPLAMYRRFQVDVSPPELFPHGVAPQDARLPDEEMLSRQCSATAQQVLEEEVLKEAVRGACATCSFCVTVADPRSPDNPLIAVSEGFEVMTGFRREEILGVNCRFLNSGCSMDPVTLQDLRQSCETGQPFTGVLTNRRKNGELFLNLLDLRGLAVGRTHTGEDIWFLVGIQADVTCTEEGELPSQLPKLKQVADAIRARIASDFGALPGWDTRTADRRIFEDFQWRGGAHLGQPPSRRGSIFREVSTPEKVGNAVAHHQDSGNHLSVLKQSALVRPPGWPCAALLGALGHAGMSRFAPTACHAGELSSAAQALLMLILTGLKYIT
ncbi:unnamed protein product [Prorocentrum cordatum]|uniref:PAS domain-containing protein n=1 Tax=Prorocentrum cordatum TaxID=2364126 RepID=A0ABN9SR18_9DINO|nr:unnamed protein product [Polarella glacialis]